MASDELKEIRKAMTKEAIREHQMARTGGTQTDLFTCGKCRKKNCTYTQVSAGCLWGPALPLLTAGSHLHGRTWAVLCEMPRFRPDFSLPQGWKLPSPLGPPPCRGPQ